MKKGVDKDYKKWYNKDTKVRKELEKMKKVRIKFDDLCNGRIYYLLVTEEQIKLLDWFVENVGDLEYTRLDELDITDLTI